MEDAEFETAFEKYTKRHYESWVTFARDKQYGDIRPFLVSGFDTTKDFAMLAFSNKAVSLEAGSQIEVPLFTSGSASIKVERHTMCSPHFKCGPQPWGLPPSKRVIGFPSLRSVNPRETPKGFNQCVFIRYYTARPRKWMPLEIIRAGAGPHDLGSGDNKGDTFPELVVQSDVEPTTSGDPDLEGQPDLTAHDTSDLVVVRNTPHV